MTQPNDPFIHPTSVVDSGANIGSGSKIWHFCHVFAGATIGEDCVVGQGCSIAAKAVIGNGVRIQNGVSVFDGVTIEDDVFCGPHMVFTNVINPRANVSRRHEYQPTRVCRGATIGAGAVILCGNTIGEYAFVGAGAVVTKDVPAHAMVYGNPARQEGWMAKCGTKLEFDSSGKATASDGTGYVLKDGAVGIET